MRIASKVAAEKALHPERFCVHCLWRIQTAQGPSPCRRHPVVVFDREAELAKYAANVASGLLREIK